MPTDRRRPPTDDPLLAEIFEIADQIKDEDIDLHLDDPALHELVDRAVAPIAPFLTPDGVEEARRDAAFNLIQQFDIEEVLDRVRSEMEREGRSTTRVKRAPGMEQTWPRRMGRRGAS